MAKSTFLIKDNKNFFISIFILKNIDKTVEAAIMRSSPLSGIPQ